MYWAIAGIAVLIFFVWASADVGSGVYLKTRCRKHTQQPVVAITFDDGPDPAMTPKVLDVLEKHGVKAAFFLIGRNVQKHPRIARRIVAQGHAVGNHTWSHAPLFALWGRSKVLQELRDTQSIIEETVGLRPRLFRPPFGVTNPIIGKAVRMAGLQGIGWSIRSLDTWKWRDRKTVCERICGRLHDGAVILLHDRCEDADLLLEYVIQEIEASGRRIVPLDELFDMECYEK